MNNNMGEKTIYIYIDVETDYTVDVTNRFRGLDLIECLKNYGQRFLALYRSSD